MKIDIIIPCALLDSNDSIEIDRFKRFQLQLENLNSIQNKPNNINWYFCEFGIESKLEKTISNLFPLSKYLFYRSKEKFNQIDCWNFVTNEIDSDFYIFSHADILFSKNIYDVLNKRIIDESKNYYAFRLNAYIKTIDILDLQMKKYSINCSDAGMKYILDVNGRITEYSETFEMNSCYDIKVESAFNQKPDSTFFIKENNQISESFIGISNKTFELLDLKREASYHNDVVIRDLSIIKNIDFEWIHDELCIIHMLGKDLHKEAKKDFDSTLEILKCYPELSYFGGFRFHPDYIPYLKNLDLKKLYEYRKNDLCRDQTFEKQLLEIL